MTILPSDLIWAGTLDASAWSTLGVGTALDEPPPPLLLLPQAVRARARPTASPSSRQLRALRVRIARSFGSSGSPPVGASPRARPGPTMLGALPGRVAGPHRRRRGNCIARPAPSPRGETAGGTGRSLVGRRTRRGRRDRGARPGARPRRRPLGQLAEVGLPHRRVLQQRARGVGEHDLAGL